MAGEDERLLKKWALLKGLDEKHEISRLRLRADVAECIRDCYGAGMTRATVARLLDVTPPRVTRLLQGNYRATEATIRRTPMNYKLAWVETEMREVIVDKEPVQGLPEPDPVCKYCGKKATYQVEWEGNTIFVCSQHKPPEMEDLE